MTDLVEQLRTQADDIDGTAQDYGNAQFLCDAADEIERLRGGPNVDEIIVWFNAWLKEPINARDRVIIESMLGHVRNHPQDIWKANARAAADAAGEKAGITQASKASEPHDRQAE